MSKITVTTIAGQTSGADANKVKIESGDTLEVVSNATVGGTLTTTGTSTFQDTSTFQGDVNVGTTTNLLSNGDFTTNTTGWTATTSTLAVVSNQLQLTPNSGVNGFANQQVDNLVVGKSYVASVAVTVDAGNYARLYIGTSANGNQTVTSSNLGVGTHSFTFVATATTHHFALVVGGGTGQVTRFDNARLTEASRIIFPAIAGTSPEIKQGTFVNDLAISTAATNRIIVAGNGEVTMPTQPSFYATLTSNQTGFDATSLGNNYVAFDSDVVDQGNNHSNGVFTAPVAGTYFFKAEVYGSVNFTQSWLVINGNRAAGTDTVYKTATNFAYYENIIHLSANDTVSFHPYISSNSNVTINVNNNHTWWKGHLLG